MDDLKIAEIPSDDPYDLERARCAGIYRYANRVVTIPFDKKELSELCRLLESIAVEDTNYCRVAECVIFAEKIRKRLTASQDDLQKRRGAHTEHTGIEESATRQEILKGKLLPPPESREDGRAAKDTLPAVRRPVHRGAGGRKGQDAVRLLGR